MHLLDQVAAAFGRFDVRYPRDGMRLGLYLEFFGEPQDARRQELLAVFDAMHDLGEVEIGLAFRIPTHPKGRSPEEALELLERSGVGVATEWLKRVEPDEPDLEGECWTFSQRVELSAECVATLAEIVLLGDFGTWNGVACEVFLWARWRHVLVRFWDDRGADVLFADAASLRLHRPAFARFEVLEGTAKLFPDTPTR
ncbi:MAG: hypothetical protein H6718_30225 [Polyangiaceae bacterium]|nr:hypothetical protein [Polyangiaceae bacterium]